MNFVTYWSKARFRATWRSSLTLAVLIGLAGGSIIALVTGGLRTDSAYPRFNAAYQGADATFYSNAPPAQAVSNMHVLERLPQVASAGIFQGYQTVDGSTVGAPLGPGFERSIGVPRLTVGRLPRHAGEVAIDWSVAQTQGLHVGDVDRVSVISDVPSPSGHAAIEQIPLRVVGITVNPGSFPPLSQLVSMLVDPSFMNGHTDVLGPPLDGLELRLRGGQAGLPAFEKAAQRAFPHQPVLVSSTATQNQVVENSIHPAAVALWLLGAALAVMSLLIFFQLFRRSSTGEEDEYVTAASQGATRRQLLAAELARTTAIAIGAAVLAVISAVALSPLFPLGTARVAEPDPGVWMDWSVLGIGVVGVVVATFALAALPSWRTTQLAAAPITVRADRAAFGTSTTWSPRWLWLRPVAWVGFLYGLRTGKGAAAVPVRASIATVLLAVSGMTGALTFGASLAHLVATPALYGWSWGAHITTNSVDGTGVIAQRLVADQWITDVTVADTGIPLRINGRTVPGADLQPIKGHVSVVTPQGRLPLHADEIVLGQNTLRELHAHLGSRVRVTVTAIAGPTRVFTVVGTTIAPWIDDQNSSFTGGGAIMIHAGLGRLVPAGARNVPPPNDAFVNFAPGAATAARIAQLRHQVGDEYSVLSAQPPTDLLNFGRVRNLPVALALFLVGLSTVTLFITLLSSASRRRSEVAVLKALGYRSAQLRGVVAWQSTVMTLVGLVVGLPLGIALGRWLWIVVADHLGFLAPPIVPAWQIALVGLGALVAANVAGAWPGRVAARTPVARILRVS